MRVLIVACAFIACTIALPRNEFQEHINNVNNNRYSTWKAGHNFGEQTTMEYVKGLCGALSNPVERASLPGTLPCHAHQCLQIVMFQGIWIPKDF